MHFFLQDVALGDVVEIEADAPRNFLVRRKVKPSGRFVLSVWFGESLQRRDEVAHGLEDLGALPEGSSKNLLAVDAPDAAHGQARAGFLADRERQGQLINETGKSA